MLRHVGNFGANEPSLRAALNDSDESKLFQLVKRSILSETNLKGIIPGPVKVYLNEDRSINREAVTKILNERQADL